MVLDTRDGADDDAEMNAAHLLTDHGYIVLQTAVRHGERMVHLRNPWGWDGATTHNADVWLNYGQIKGCCTALESAPPAGVDLGLPPDDLNRQR